MKAGPHSGNSLDVIIKMKKEEEEKFGIFYWGYSGTLCHPFKIQKFAMEAIKNKTIPKLLFSVTESAYNPPGIKKVYKYSLDARVWKDLPTGVYLWNCDYAIIATNLKEVEAYVDLNEYVVTEKKKRLGEYLRYRVNKACAKFYGATRFPRLVKVKYVADIVSPFCVFLK